MTYALPSLLTRTDNWGAFIFFAAWCAAGLIYVYLLVPEIAGLTVEEIDKIFKGSWFANRNKSRAIGTDLVLEGQQLRQQV